MLSYFERPRHARGRLQLAHVPLPVPDAECVKREALVCEDRRSGVGVQPAGKQHDRSFFTRQSSIRNRLSSLRTSHLALRTWHFSDASRTRVPNVLMQLQLDPYGKAICKHPLTERA